MTMNNIPGFIVQLTRERDLARSERDLAQKALASAPHDKRCALLIPIRFHNSWECDCWKSKIVEEKS